MVSKLSIQDVTFSLSFILFHFPLFPFFLFGKKLLNELNLSA